MEPKVLYARSDDGTSVAYSTFGHGRPLIFVGHPGNLFTLDGEWRIPRVRRAMEQLAERRMFVRTDPRGRGLSDRDVADRSLDAHLADLRCVVEALDAGPVDLVASGISMVGAFAALHPDLVRKSVICLTLPMSFRMSPLRKKLGELAAIDFNFYKQALALRNFGWIEGRLAAEQMENLTLDELNNGYRDGLGWDETVDLSRVQCPLLVVHRRGAEVDVPLADSRRLASSVPHGELRVVDAAGTTVFDEDGLVARAIIEYLDGDEPSTQPAPRTRGLAEALPLGAAVILFTDIVSSTALTERMGDARFRDASRALDAGLRAAIHGAGGAAIAGKLLGDGVLATFASAAQAIEAARHCHTLSAASELGLHIGLHAGDVIREDNNVYGGAVNIASRICALSKPSEILVSDVVRGMARSSAGVDFEDRGEQELNGVTDPVHIYAVRWQE